MHVELVILEDDDFFTAMEKGAKGVLMEITCKAPRSSLRRMLSV